MGLFDNPQIVAVIIQEGSRIASEMLRSRGPSKLKSEPVDLEQFVMDTPSRFPSLQTKPTISIVAEQPAGQTPSTAVININTETAIEKSPQVEIAPGKAKDIATGCVPCMPPDSLIWGNPSIKEISKVAIGSRVIDREGNYTKVLRASQRPYNGDLIEITIPGQNIPIRLTPNHRVLAIKGIGCRRNHGNTLCFPKESCGKCIHRYEAEFVEAGELSTKGKRNSWSRHILLQPVLNGQTDDIILNVMEIANVFPKYIRNRVNEKILINNDFLKLAGFYLAEGSVVLGKRGAVLRFDFGSTEQNLVDETISLLSKVFGVTAKYSKDNSTLRVYISSTILGHFFINYFGNGAAHKHIPQDILILPPQKQATLLYGFWLGDGSWLVSYNRNVLSASTISPNLAFGIKTILNRLGIVHGINTHVTRETKINGRMIKGGTPQFIIQINSNGAAKLNLLWGLTKEYHFVQSSQSGIDANFVYLPIKKIKKVHYEGIVMNIETESNTYCANGIVTHNCAMGHFGTCSGILNESIRFAKGADGMKSPEVIDRVNMCLDELNAMERVDLRPEMTVQLEGWQKELADKALSESRNIRHTLEGIHSYEDLEAVAARTQTSRKQIGREWFKNALPNMSPEDKEEVKRRVLAKIEAMAAAEE